MSFFQHHAVLLLFCPTPFIPPPNSSIFLQKYDGHCGQLRHEQKAFLVPFERPLLFRLWHLECLKWFGLAVFFFSFSVQRDINTFLSKV